MDLDRHYRAYARDPIEGGERLGRGLSAWLRAYFRRRFPGQLVDDLVQSAAETVWRQLPTFTPRHHRAFTHWVTSIARIVMLRARQRSGVEGQRQGEFESALFEHPGTGPSSHLRRQRALELLESEFESLDTKLRRALSDQLEGGSVRAYADRERLPSATVRTHRRRARERLRLRLAEREQTPSSS